MKKPVLLNIIGSLLVINGIMSIFGQKLIFNVLKVSNLLSSENALFVTVLYSVTALISIVSGVLLFKGNKLGEWIYLLYMPISILLGIIKIGFSPMVISSGVSCILIYFLLNTKDIKGYMNSELHNKDKKLIDNGKYKLVGIFLYGISLLVITGGVLLIFETMSRTEPIVIGDLLLLLFGILIHVVAFKFWDINKSFMTGVTIIVMGSLGLINSITFSLLERLNHESIYLGKYIIAGSISLMLLLLGRSLILKAKRNI